MQKAVFLVTQMRSLAPQWRNAYNYAPYNWGPYSSALNEDLSNWRRRGLMTLSFAGATRYGRYVLTREGDSVAEIEWHQLNEASRALLTDVRAWVTSKDFNSLLREVYSEFPEFAAQSRWKGNQ